MVISIKNFFVTYLRPIAKALLAIVAVAVVAAFPHDAEFHNGHAQTLVFWIVILSLIGFAIWDALEKVDSERTSAVRLKEAAFFTAYGAKVSSALDILQDLPKYDVKNCDDAIQNIIVMIRAVVGAYAEDRNQLKLNVNIMLPRIFVPEEATQIGLHFYEEDKRPDAYQCVLVLHRWADDDHCVPPTFALPVYKTNDSRMLFGAPRAFASGAPQIVADIKDDRLLKRLVQPQPQDVKQQILSYFNQRDSFRSFLSLKLPGDHGGLGVLNMQCMQPGAFGTENKLSAEFERFVLPLCGPLLKILGILVARRAALISTQPTSATPPATARTGWQLRHNH